MIHNLPRFRQWLPAGFDGEFAWDFLIPAFQLPIGQDNKATKIEPMDLDATVERNGHFLIFETKSDGKPIPLGQQITLGQLWKDGNKTIVHLEGKTSEEITGCALYAEGRWQVDIDVGSKPMKPCDYGDVQYLARRWFCFADGKSVESREEFEHKLWLWDNDGRP